MQNNSVASALSKSASADNVKELLAKSRHKYEYIEDFRGDPKRPVYLVKLPDGELKLQPVGLDGSFCLYQFKPYVSCLAPITWTMSDVQDIQNIYLAKDLEYKRISVRRYGQPKLQKPAEIKGRKQSFSVPLVFDLEGKIKASCKCFIDDSEHDTLYIQCSDYFSPLHRPRHEDIGTPLGYRTEKYFGFKPKEKFTYADNWGGIVLRSEAWLCFSNTRPLVMRSAGASAAQALMDAFVANDERASACLQPFGYNSDNQWEDFFVALVRKYRAYIEQRNSAVEIDLNSFLKQRSKAEN